ncbi:STY4851/ECs_5259 family protein [Vibrio splendidus]|uniref:STY4851/ECs_5259 family protein n=1 Tax=Vibrio splendidus TaxID=29497 RepID=UPI000ECDEBF3|nr:STY4851/ECs_5259 family protein [Vibrio splendidus]NOI89776.1 hypothetical protein [Vibrio splendidus]RIH72039.1 hypothetical protein BJG01_02900 [Vibrio splendidus]
MNTFKTALKSIFDIRELSSPSGDPIYSYKLSLEEAKVLKSALCSSIESNGVHAYVQSNSREWAGAFVLYAAEWWRNEFSGGHWSWEPIFSSLNISEADITASNRNKLIAAGLRFWRRPILTNGQGHMYLGSVAVEGGLPLTLVTDPSSKLSHYFEQVIKDFGKYTLSKPNSYEIAKAHDHCIASSFRTDAVYSVVGKIAEAIYTLTDEYNLDEQSEPLRYLDAVAPNWLDKLPLNIDQETGKGLLDSALGQAIAVQRRLPSTIRLVRRLTKTFSQHAYLIDESSDLDEKWQCKLALTLRQSVNAHYIQQLFCMSSLPSRFSLFAMGKKPLLLAKAFRPKNNPDKYLLDVMTNELPNDWFDCEVQLMVRCDDNQTWYAPLVGGSALSSDEPWVFTDSEEDWVLVGSGDVTNEANKAVVAMSETMSLTTDSNSSVTSNTKTNLLGKTEVPYIRDLYLLEQRGSYKIEDFIVTLGEETKNQSEYIWHGDELPYQTTPTKCYIGKPQLQTLSSEGVAHRVPSEKLRWHDLSKQQWLSIETLPLGQSEVALVENGKPTKRFRLASLPNDLDIEFIPGQRLNRGQVVISSSRPPMVSVNLKNSDALDYQVTRSGHTVTIDLFSATDQPPAIVDLDMWWQEKPKAISMRLPFPSKGICLLDGEQRLVENHSELLIDNLNSYELYGHGIEGGVELNFLLQANDIRGAFSRSAYFSTVLPSVEVLASGLSLSTFRADIQALFALSATLDAKIKVSVLNHGHELFSCSLASYVHPLQPNRDSHLVELTSGSIPSALYTVPLGRPDQTPMRLIETEQSSLGYFNSWHFPDDEIEAGAWLVYCDESKYGVRPLMWSKNLELLPQASNGFEHASGIGRRADRLTAFSEVAKEMAYDFTRSEWKYVRTLLSFECVPVTTFDLWRGVTRRPEFMLALLLNANRKEIEKVWQMDKQFPLLWYSLNMASGVKVVTAFYDYLVARLGEDMADVAQNRIEKKLSELVSFFPGLSPLVELMKFKIGLTEQKPSLEPRAYIQHVFDCRNTLSQRKADVDVNSWPHQFADHILGTVMAKMKPDFVQLCLTNNFDRKNNTMNAPMILALATIGQAELSMTPEVVHAMREYRRFDPDYFDDCFALTQKMIIGLVTI